MLGIARHHQKQPVQQAHVIYFVTSNTVTYNTGTYDSVEFGLTGLQGGVDDVELKTLNYYVSGNTSHPFRGFSLPAGQWVIDFSYTFSANTYETALPTIPPGTPNHFTIRKGDPVIPPNANYTPIWNSNSTVVWRNDTAGGGGSTDWEAYNSGGTYYWRTKQPITVNNSLTNSTSTQAITLTETTNFWITLNMLKTKNYIVSPATITVSRLA